MKHPRFASQLLASLCLASVVATVTAQQASEVFKPVEGQAGKDVVWVPTTPELLQKMLDMARVTPQDYVMDLGSGDGRNIIAAARRGARALGVEYNPDMVELSRRNAAAAGVADKARFEQGDMYEADISQANVLALFLLPQNLDRLAPKFLALAPGSRIVSNTFEISGWSADEVQHIGDTCYAWCKSLLYIVPANAAGTWQSSGNLPGELRLEQRFQVLTGTLTSNGKTIPVVDGRLSGKRISFKLGTAVYEGEVEGGSMSGAIKGRETAKWSATRH